MARQVLNFRCLITTGAYLFFLLLINEKVTANCQQQKQLPVGNNNRFFVPDTSKRKESLDKILSFLPPDRTANGRVSFLDQTFQDWLKRTGELPPDFDKMPSIPFLPNPMILDEGGKAIPVKTMSQWEKKRQWMKEQIKYYITGTCPPPPDNLKARILGEKKEGTVILRTVELTFGPQQRATLTVELIIPPGKGPFPVYMTPWDHRNRAQIAVRRGYIACVYAASDLKDDTEKYAEIWSPEYDFTRLMRRAYATSRAIDYLVTLSIVDKGKIGLVGHSRNGKLALTAAAFDERIAAVIPSSGGSGAEVPWRYNSIKYDVEDLALLTSAQPAWFHPRLRFFIGQENKLPIDQNSFMALVAPRGLMLSTAINEGASNPWAIEQVYHSTQKIYDFLGSKNNIAIRFRKGEHGTNAGDIEDYIDFFDYVFKRNNRPPPNKLLYDYTFANWCAKSGEQINPLSYPVKDPGNLLTGNKGEKIASVKSWEDKKINIQRSIQWGLGDAPPGVTISRSPNFKSGESEEYFGSVLKRPKTSSKMGVMNLSPLGTGSHDYPPGFGDYLYGYLYYPLAKQETIKTGKEKLPVIIYLHEYDYSKGFTSYHQVDPIFESLVDQGYAVFSYDMMGFGNRIEEGTRFYDRYPHWSKMGKLVEDVKGAIDAITNLDFVDSTKVFVVGYSLGATVGLYSAALDKRIAGVVSICGFTPMRSDTPGKGTEGVKAYSHLHGLLPRLGFFIGNEAHLPYDFTEVLASIAPRPLLVIAPKLDKDASYADIQNCVNQDKKVYGLYNATDNIQVFSPDDYNRFSDEMRKKVYEWTNNKR